MKKVLFIIQCLLVLAMLVLGILYFCGYKGLIDIIELALAGDLLFLGFNNLVMCKNKKYALIYFVVGGIMLVGVILKMVGVRF